MDTDLERRIARAVKGIVESVPVDPPPRSVVGHPRGAGWWAPALTAAAAVLLLAAIAVVLPGLSAPGRRSRPPGAPGTAPGTAVLPTEFAGMSLLTAAVSDAPPGPAIALYRQGSLGTRFGTSQLLVVGADGRTYRRLDLAERRGFDAPDGEWRAADALLAPDGAAVAVADTARRRDRIEVVDLRTGRVSRHRLDRPAAVRLLDWSPDGRWLAFAAYDTPADETEAPGQPALLDTRTGAVRRFAGLAVRLGSASFAPDGGRIAIAHTSRTPAGQMISVVDLNGTVLRELPEADSIDIGPGAWSPDGRFLVGTDTGPRGRSLAFLDTTGRYDSLPAPVRYTGCCEDGQVLGWRSPDAVVVAVGARSLEIVEVPVTGGPRHRLSRISDGIGGFAQPAGIQLAEGLIGTARVRDAGAQRGPWPAWWRLTVAVTALLVGWRILRARRAQRRTD